MLVSSRTGEGIRGAAVLVGAELELKSAMTRAEDMLLR